MRVVTVTQAMIDKLPADQRTAAKAIIAILDTKNTAIEQMLGIQVVWVDAPVTPEPVPTPDIQQPKPEVDPCGCDLSRPLVDPPFTAAYLKSRGNAEECPVPGGRDIRTRVKYPSGGCKSIGSLWPADEFTVNADGTITAQCVEKDGFQYHVTGWIHNDSDWADQQPGRTFRYKTTTFIFAECRRVS